MGLAGQQRRRRSAHYVHAQSGQPNLRRPLPRLRQRRLGARLLPEIQQPPSRISDGLVERNQLGRSKRPLRSLQERQSRPRTSSSRRLNQSVILSGVAASQSEAATQSKDPYTSSV